MMTDSVNVWDQLFEERLKIKEIIHSEVLRTLHQKHLSLIDYYSYEHNEIKKKIYLEKLLECQKEIDRCRSSFHEKG